MSSRIERLPFTVYDIMGYLIPGAYLTIYAVMFLHGDFVRSIMTTDMSASFFYYVILTFVFLIESYVLGHIIAFISAESIERLCVGFFGYPSQASLLDRDDKNQVMAYCESQFTKFFTVGKFQKVFLMICFPLHTILLRVLSTTIWYRIAIKSVGKEIRARIDKKFRSTFKIDPNKLSGQEWFHMIDHYIFTNNERVAARQYNYVTIYGFCRNMCLGVYVVLLLDVAMIVGWLPNSAVNAEKIYYDLVFNLLLTLALLVAFLKFYRRYSQDSLMAFAVMDAGGTAKSDQTDS